MQNFVTQFGNTVRTQNAFYVPAEDAKMSFVDSRDIAAISSKILTNNGLCLQYANREYDITGSDALSYSQAAEILSNEIGIDIEFNTKCLFQQEADYHFDI